MVRNVLRPQSGGRYAAEYRTIGIEDGQERWIVAMGRAFFGRGGRPVRFLGTTLDITGRKAAEQKIRQQNTVLDGINRIFSQALAHDTEEELGRICLAVAEDVTESRLGFLAGINAEGRLEDIAISDSVWDVCRMQNRTGHNRAPAGFTVHGIYGRVLLDEKGFYTNHPASHADSIGTPEGHPPMRAFLGVPLKHDGRTIGMLAVGNREGGYRPRDLDALEALAGAAVQVLMRKRAEHAVRAGEERLRHAQKMESIGVLAGGIAHDFNNLLTSILGNASLLQAEPAGSSEQLKAIVESSEKAAALTRQLLAYAGKGTFRITNFDISRLVRSSANLLRVSIPKNIEVQLDVPRSLPAVRGDPSQIQQVMMNLVINAAEAIQNRSGGRVSIATGIRNLGPVSASRLNAGIAPGRYIFITVQDNGCGMDEQTKAKIFDPFFTTKFTGRGLGLAAVDGILRSHKGAITVESGPGRGSTFTVYLPCSALRATESGHLDAVTGSDRAATVLVVDDEEPVRAFTRTALERLGYRVLIAENGREALDLLCGHADVNLVLLDVIMPVLGGAEAFLEMRKKWPKLPVLVASGYSRQEAQRLGIPDGLPFIEKPYTLRTLAAAVEKSLQVHTC
jgi:signal transduction histidine kinase